uniref:NADH-ubiquinone oxidoreductase chain 4 n=1 Tax=Hymenoptera sp. 4 GYN-2021 TaxID=2876101 RepID=A0A977XTQ7_9HYME|nr:NADH dehydrogenase subunit 4 [Hymenoptera sp. 4 GYN-2021]
MFKFFFYLLFLIPLSFLEKFWLSQFFLFLGGFMFLFLGSYSFEFSNLSIFLGCDLLSFGLILLTFWICSLMIMSSMMIYELNNFIKYFLFLIFMMVLFLFLTFSVMNLFLFYFFFECSLIPTLCLILGWGFQLDRLQAGLYLLFYTLFASLPFLFGLFYLYFISGTMSFLMFFENIVNFDNIYLYICMIFAFLVKMPMFLVHLWLPKAHVEAPISGSMILAGVMLKLGGYGLLRMMKIFIEVGNKFNYIFISISLIGGILVSLMCFFQVDMKSLIAYSSVVHMSMLLMGLFTYFNWGLMGSYLLMISHGLCSSGMFCLVNVVYERLGSRSLMVNKGLINFMPSMSLWWFLLCSSNMAAPPSLNLMGEIMLINSIISWSNLSLFLLIFLSFFSAFYTLYLYSFTQHGKFNYSIYSFSQGYLREFLLMFLHWIPLNFLIINSELFILWV